MNKYIRKANILSEPFDEKLVMLDLKLGKYFSLNSVGKRIWELLEEPVSNEEICSNLFHEFNVDKEKCKQEVQSYLTELKKRKLIELRK